MRLWVDDVKDPLGAGLFGLEEVVDGEHWTWAKDSEEALSALFGDVAAKSSLFADDTRVTELALDNDLGYLSTMDGRDIASAILDRVLDDPSYTPPAKMTCISHNFVAAPAIEATFRDIERAMKERG